MRLAVDAGEPAHQKDVLVRMIGWFSENLK